MATAKSCNGRCKKKAVTREDTYDAIIELKNDPYSIAKFLEKFISQNSESFEFVVQHVSNYNSIYINVRKDGDIVEKIRISDHYNKSNKAEGANIVIGQTIEETADILCDELLFDGSGNFMY